jgi:peptidyl-prolyl cis-trans isomerase D
MLKVLRKKGVMKKILWVVALLIIVTFGFLSQIYLFKSSGRNKYAGKIFGQKVSLASYDYNLMQTRVQAMMQYGPDFQNIANFLDLYSQTWDRLILLHEAKKQRIKVSDDETVKAIQAYPFFYKNGTFDKELYQLILQNYFHQTARDFEEGVRDTIKFMKLFESVTKDVSIPDTEAFELYKKANEKVQVSYVLFSPEDYKNQVAFDETKAKAYYLSNREEFMLPPMIQVEYIRIDYPKEATVEKAGPENKDTASPPSNLPEEKAEVSAATKEATMKLAQSVARALNDTPDFATVAQTFKLLSGTSQFFSMEEPDLSFGWSFALIQGLFQLKPDETVGPVETINGYQILRLKDRRESYIPEYQTAQDTVKEKWIRNEALKIADQKGQEILGKISDAVKADSTATFVQIAETLGLKVSLTELFKRGQYLPTVGLSPSFQDAAFGLTDKQKLSPLVETERGYCLLYLSQFEPVNNDQYQKDKEEFVATLLKERKNIVFNEFLIKLRLNANLENNIPELMNKGEKE